MSQDKHHRKLRQISQRTGRILLAIVYMAITVGLLFGIYWYGDYTSPLFWIVGIVQIALAYLTVIPTRWDVLRVLLFVAAGSLPLYLARNVEGLEPIRMTWLVYIIAGGWMAYYKSWHE